MDKKNHTFELNGCEVSLIFRNEPDDKAVEQAKNMIVATYIKKSFHQSATLVDKRGQTIVDSRYAKLINYLYFWNAGTESDKTSMRTKEALEQMTAKGLFTGGVPPYGYKLEKLGRTNKRGTPVNDLVVDPDEAAVIRLVYERYNQYGEGTHTIANHLTAQGIKTRKGENFTSPTIRHFLKNQIYRGIMKNGNQTGGPFDHLRIIDDDTFHRTQEIASQKINRTESTNTTPLRTKSDNVLLSGNIFCGCCGGKLNATPIGRSEVLKSGDVKEYRYWRYVCYNKTRHKHRCNGQTGYRSARIDATVLNVLSQYFQAFQKVDISDYVEGEVHQALAQTATALKKAEATLKKCNADLASLNAEIAQAVRGESAFTPEQLKQAIDQTTVQRDMAETSVMNLSKEYSEREVKNAEAKKNYQQIMSWSEMFNECDIQAKKMIIHSLIKRISISRGKKPGRPNIEIEFNISVEQFFMNRVPGPAHTAPILLNDTTVSTQAKSA